MSEITQLPDGSGCFTATVMSREEAMKLPVEKRPICYRISSEMYHAVFAAIGEAMTLGAKAVDEGLNSERASEVAVNLCFKIAEELENQKLIAPDVFGKFNFERWEDDEYVITCKAGPIGQTLYVRTAQQMSEWLNAAIPEAIQKLSSKPT